MNMANYLSSLTRGTTQGGQQVVGCLGTNASMNLTLSLPMHGITQTKTSLTPHRSRRYSLALIGTFTEKTARR